jgi:hypothetical protein
MRDYSAPKMVLLGAGFANQINLGKTTKEISRIGDDCHGINHEIEGGN